eukprot:6592594-Prymnesium_polylepis.1
MGGYSAAPRCTYESNSAARHKARMRRVRRPSHLSAAALCVAGPLQLNPTPHGAPSQGVRLAQHHGHTRKSNDGRCSVAWLSD